jgi:hypothetical protein
VTVYVDGMYKRAMGRFGRMKMSHMLADSEQELHEMADRIGLDRKHYQVDHYDVSMSRRAIAVYHGAIEVELRVMARMRRIRAETGRLPTPAEAEASIIRGRAKGTTIGAQNRNGK